MIPLDDEVTGKSWRIRLKSSVQSHYRTYGHRASTIVNFGKWSFAKYLLNFIWLHDRGSTYQENLSSKPISTHLKRIFSLYEQEKNLSYTVVLVWVPGHSGVHVNESANSGARHPATTIFRSDPISIAVMSNPSYAITTKLRGTTNTQQKRKTLPYLCTIRIFRSAIYIKSSVPENYISHAFRLL